MAYQHPASLEADAKCGAYRDPRVSFFLRPGDELVQCYYDKSHWVLTTKIIGHLVKCRHNYLNAVKNGSIKVTELTKVVVCPYNTVHHMPQGDMKDHLDNSCASNPFRTDFFKQLEEEKARQDRIKEQEKLEAGGGSSSKDFRPTGDPGSGPYGEAQNSSAGFWGKDQKPEAQRGYSSSEVKMEQGGEGEQGQGQNNGQVKVEPKVEGAVGQPANNVKQEPAVLDTKRNVTVKQETATTTTNSTPGKNRPSYASSVCGGSRAGSVSGGSVSAASSTVTIINPGAAIAANLLKLKKEEEAYEMMSGKWARPGRFSQITTPYSSYKGQHQQDKKSAVAEVVYDDRGLTQEQSQDPDHNWELALPTTERHNPMLYLKRSENQGRIFIQNPQGLTRSERAAWRAKQAELLMIERPEEEAKEEKANLGGGGGGQRTNIKKDLSGYSSSTSTSTYDPDQDHDAIRARAARLMQKKELERQQDQEMELDDAEPPPITLMRKMRNRRAARPACPGFELNLDMQQNPVEEYEKRNNGGNE